MESILNPGLPHICEKIFKCLDNITDLANFGLACRFLKHESKIFIEDMLFATKFYQKYNQSGFCYGFKAWNSIIQSLITGWPRYSLILYIPYSNCATGILI